MKFVYVLEDDPKFQQEIAEAISIIDPKIQIRLFNKLEDFVSWLKLLMTTGPAAIAKGGSVQTYVPQETVSENDEHQLVLVVSKIEFLGVEQLELLKKTRKLFIDRKVCTAEDPTAFVLTAFDNPNFKIRDLENRILNNVILKPFDKLILIQHLTCAIDGRHPPSKFSVTNQKTSAIVELLKDISMEAFSDIGFVTKSDREIPVGAVGKYYSEFFLSDRHRSLFAICRNCGPHPTEPGMFQASFTFFGADQTQISNMRKRTRDKSVVESSYSWVQKNSGKHSDLQVILLDDEEASPSGLQGKLEKRFSGVETHVYHSFANFYADLDPTESLQQRDGNLKALGGANTVTLHFDLGGTTYLDFASDKLDLTTLFGMTLNELKAKSNWFQQALAPEHKDRYRKLVNSATSPEDGMLSLTVNDTPFIVKVTAVNKDGGRFHMTLIEPSKDEQIAWLKRNSRLQKPVHLIIASHRFFSEGAAQRWGNIKETLKRRFNIEPQIIVTSKKDFSDAEERELGSFVSDIFFKPVDPTYFLQKIRVMYPGLSERTEKTEIKTIQQTGTLKTVNPVNVTEISEAGFVMKYYRSISLGSFREVVLWQPYEIGAPELLATCNYVEESQSEKGAFNCHFIFFGATDHFLKHIRIWIRDNYVLSKEGQAS